jgi:hypothetical protein
VAASRIKGAAFREFIAWLGETYGKQELERVVRHIPDQKRASFRLDEPTLGVLASSWYEASVVHAFLDALAVGRSDDEVDRIATRGSIAALERTLSGVHRALLRVVGSPDLHARFAQRLWSTYYTDGVVRSTRVAPTRQRIAFSQWRSHHPTLCKITTASDRVIFPSMGLRGVSVTQDTCVVRGDPDCAHFVDWA